MPISKAPSFNWPMSTRKRDLIIGIGDMHLPFVSMPVFNWILNQVIRKHKNRIYAIVQMGDLYDRFSYSRFPKRLIMTPREETYQGYDMAEKMWARIRKAAPKAKLFQIKGNHDARLAKRIVEIMPELDHLIDYKELYEFDGVETIHDESESLEIRGWHFIHGFTKPGKHIEAVHFNNVVCAHTHKGGTWSKRLHQKKNPKVLTELNCGYVGDPFHEALVYRPLKKFFDWTWGVGAIDGMGGRFIPYSGRLK